MNSFQPGMIDPAAGNLTFRNRLLNGAFTFWQRGTSISVPASGTTYAADRWIIDAYNGSSQIACTAAQSSSVPAVQAGANGAFVYSASLAAASGTVLSAMQRIEGANTCDLVGQPIVLSFWASISSGGTTPTIAVSYSTPSALDSYTTIAATASATVTPPSLNSWYFFTVAFPALPSSASNGLMIKLTLTNAGAAARLAWLLTGVQVEKGVQATPFEFRQYGVDQSMCYRYYEVVPVVTLERWNATSNGTFGAASSNYPYLAYKHTASPIVTLYSGASATGTAGVLSTSISGTASTSGSFTVTADANSLLLSNNKGVLVGASDYANGSMTVDAEIY